MQTITTIVLIPMVYLAFGIFVGGCVFRIVRLLRTPPHPTTLQIFPKKEPSWLYAMADTLFMPTVRRHNPVLWVFLMLFHGALVLLIIGHLELIKDFSVFQVIPHEVFLGKGFVGLTAALSLLYFLFRRFASPVRDISVPEDYYLLVLLFLTVIFGSQMDWARRWYDYDVMGVDAYRDYLWSLITLHPQVPDDILFSGHSFMLVLHVFFANLFLMILPFSKIMHTFFAYPVNRLRRG